MFQSVIEQLIDGVVDPAELSSWTRYYLDGIDEFHQLLEQTYPNDYLGRFSLTPPTDETLKFLANEFKFNNAIRKEFLPRVNFKEVV